MAWITTKSGKRVNTEWFEKEQQIDKSKKEADTREIQPLIAKATAAPADLLVSERKQLEDYVDKYGTEQGTLYRGLDLPDYAIKKLKVGNEFPMEDRLTSFTPDKDSAEEFAKRHLRDFSRFGNNAVILKDENGVGIDISDMSKYTGEKEVLVNNKGDYIISKVETIQSKAPGYHGHYEDVDIYIVTVKRKGN